MFSRRAFVFSSAVAVLRGQEPGAHMFSNAEAYERFMGRWSRMVAAPLVDFANVPNRGRVLDVGSGTGALAFTMAEQKLQLQIAGIDVSKEYIAYASSKNRFPDRVSFEVGDAQRLPFPNASFDAGVSLLVFNFIPDPKQALAEMRRTLKPGGRLSAAVWDYSEGMRMLRTFWDAVVKTDPSAETLDEKHMPLCRAGELSDLWRSGGIEDVREHSIDINMQFRSFADYWDAFLLGQGPAGAYAATLGHTRLKWLREEVRRRLSLPAEDRPFALPARVWSVRGNVPKSV